MRAISYSIGVLKSAPRIANEFTQTHDFAFALEDDENKYDFILTDHLT